MNQQENFDIEKHSEPNQNRDMFNMVDTFL